jgi:hypothetical protein
MADNEIHSARAGRTSPGRSSAAVPLFVASVVLLLCWALHFGATVDADLAAMRRAVVPEAAHEAMLLDPISKASADENFPTKRGQRPWRKTHFLVPRIAKRPVTSAFGDD